MTTGPSTGIDVIAPGRQDRFLENRNPVFRSADIIVAPPRLSSVLAAVLKKLRVLRFVLSLDTILTPPYEAPCEKSQGYEESISMTEYKYPPLPVTEVFLKEITDKIVQALKPEKIFLFGSYAYGNPGKDGDLDLLIIMESSESPAKQISSFEGDVTVMENWFELTELELQPPFCFNFPHV